MSKKICICINCDVYSNRKIKCKSCKEYLVEIDEYLVEAIQTLNTKGYFTNYCCEGHSHIVGGGFYISFIDLYSELESSFNDSKHFITDLHHPYFKNYTTKTIIRLNADVIDDYHNLTKQLKLKANYIEELYEIISKLPNIRIQNNESEKEDTITESNKKS